jgi:hypothetical protein
MPGLNSLSRKNDPFAVPLESDRGCISSQKSAQPEQSSHFIKSNKSSPAKPKFLMSETSSDQEDSSNGLEAAGEEIIEEIIEIEEDSELLSSDEEGQ